MENDPEYQKSLHKFWGIDAPQNNNNEFDSNLKNFFGVDPSRKNSGNLGSPPQNFDKNLNNFFGVDSRKNSGINFNQGSPFRVTNKSNLLKMQREMDVAKNKLRFNPITNQPYY